MKKTLIPAFVTLLATSGTCLGEASFWLYQLPDPAPGLRVFWLHAHDTDTFKNIVITGEVHQANIPRSGGRIFPTVWLSDFILPAEAGDAAVDTHFLLNEEDVVKEGADVVETNPQDNPAGLPSSPDYEYGNGTFGAPGLSFTVNGPASQFDPNGYDLLQLVLARDGEGGFGSVMLSWSYWEYDSLDPGWRAIAADWLPIYPYPEPEPGTIAMLVMGALCLVGYRLRKW